MREKIIQPQDKYVLRLPDGMRDQLKAEAENNGRSLNAEIIYRLEESMFGARGSSSIDEIATAISKRMIEAPFVAKPSEMDRFHRKYEEIKKQEAQAKAEFLRLANEILATMRGSQNKSDE